MLDTKRRRSHLTQSPSGSPTKSLSTNVVLKPVGREASYLGPRRGAQDPTGSQTPSPKQCGFDGNDPHFLYLCERAIRSSERNDWGHFFALWGLTCFSIVSQGNDERMDFGNGGSSQLQIKFPVQEEIPAK